MFPSRRIATMGGDKFRDEYSLSFDGSDDKLDAGDITVFAGLSDMSISAWVKVSDSASGTNPIMAKGSYTSDGASFHLN